MGAAIFEAVDGAVGIAHHDHRHGADEVGAIVALLGNVGLEADEVPGVALEQALQLALVVRLVLVDPVGHARDRVFRPARHSRNNLGMGVHATLLIPGLYSNVTLADLMTLRQRASSSLMK